MKIGMLAIFMVSIIFSFMTTHAQEGRNTVPSFSKNAQTSLFSYEIHQDLFKNSTRGGGRKVRKGGRRRGRGRGRKGR